MKVHNAVFDAGRVRFHGESRNASEIVCYETSTVSVSLNKLLIMLTREHTLFFGDRGMFYRRRAFTVAQVLQKLSEVIF